MFNKLTPIIVLFFASYLPNIAFSEELDEAESSFLMDEIKLRTSTGSPKSSSSSIVNFLKESDAAVEAVTDKAEAENERSSSKKTQEVVSGEQDTDRIKSISSTGSYQKKTDKKLRDKALEKAPDSKEKTVAKDTKPKDKKSVKKVSNKNKSSKKKSSRYCLGGSYDALAKRAKSYEESIEKYSKKYSVSSALIKAVITAESCFNEKALSPKGAEGLMQLMPGTASRFGISNSYNPDSNIKGGTRYLQFLLKYFKDDLVRTIAAYNAGEGAVDKYDGVPPYNETKNYVKKVAVLYKLYSQGSGDLSELSALGVLTKKDLRKLIFTPQVMPASRFSPYKDRKRNISRGNCANKTSTRLRKSTMVQSGGGVWQRTYRVKSGDTLLRVMQATGIHKSKIAQMNGLSSRAKLKDGQRLLIWECRK